MQTPDPEGEALDREIAADRREAKQGRLRLLLYVPPLLALFFAGIGLALSRPREVVSGRVIAGPAPGPNQPWTLRAMAFRAVPGEQNMQVATGVALRITGSSSSDVVETSDDGVAELTLPPPISDRPVLEAREGQTWRRLAVIDLQKLPPRDPTHGLKQIWRTTGSSSGNVKVDVAPELSMLSPPLRGAIWVRAQKEGKPLGGATVDVSIESGASGAMTKATTSALGLVRIPITPTAPPVVIEVTVTAMAAQSKWRGVLGSGLGVPLPQGDGRIGAGVTELTLAAPSGRSDAYWDLWHDGMRVGGGRVRFEGGVARVKLPQGARGVYELETALGPDPANPDDLAHAASIPIVVAPDAMDAWAEIATSPRFPEKITTTGGTSEGYADAVAFQIARAQVAIPPRAMVIDGMPTALGREVARTRTVRRVVVAGIVGGGFFELGLMLWLGVLGSRTAVDDALAALDSSADGGAGSRPKPRKRDEGARKVLALLIAGIGIVALIFASTAMMAWGLP